MIDRRVLIVVALLALITMPVTTATAVQQPESPCEGGVEEVVVEKYPSVGYNIEYRILFERESGTLCAHIENQGSGEVSSAFGFKVDHTGFSPEMPTLEENESKFVSMNVTKYISATRDNHTVSVNAGGSDFVYSFTHQLNSSNPRVPTPYISNIQISRSEKTPKVVATVHNPGERAYGIHVRAETFETHSEVEIGAPQPGNSSEYTLELNESPSDVIAGKVMVYDDINQSDGKFDQKEFMAKPNGTANAWDDHFEQVPGGTVDSSYSNETARQYREGYVNDEALSPFKRRAGAVLVVLVAVGAVLWRRSN